jgi:hypothetical protein
MYMPWRSKGDDDADDDESRGVRGSVFEQTLMFPLAPTARLVSVLPPTILWDRHPLRIIRYDCLQDFMDL